MLKPIPTRFIVLLLALVATVFAAHRAAPAARLADVDTPTVLLSNQLTAPSDVVRLFSQEIRRDVDPSVRFYRPVTGLSYAIDQALFGLSSRALHGVNISLHALATLLFASLLTALGLRFSLVALAGVLYALHPIGVDVIPAISRRADLLATVGILLSLLARTKGHARWSWLAAAVAPLAKETALILPLLWAALEGRSWTRARRAFALGVSAMLPALVLRLLALQGFGGYAEPIWSPRAVLRIPFDVLDPERVLTTWVSRILIVVLLGWALRSAWQSRSRPLVLGLSWLFGAVALALFGGEVARWYLYSSLPACLLVLCAWIDVEWSRSRRVQRACVALSAAAVVVAMLLPSPLWIDYPEWREAGRLQSVWTEELRAKLESGSMREGEPVILLGVPMMVSRGADTRFTTRSASVALGYTLSDALELEHGLHLPVWCAVQVHPQRIGARYSIEVTDEPDGVRVSCSGPVRLDGFDLLGDWRASEPPPFQLEREGDEFRLRELEAALWRWDGEALVPVGP